MEISEGFINFFSNIGPPNLGKNIPSSKNKLSDYLSEETKENFFANMTPTVINKE